MRIETGWMVRLDDGHVGRILSIDETGIRIELSESVRLVSRSQIRQTFRAMEASARGYSPKQVSIAEDIEVLGDQDGGGR